MLRDLEHEVVLLVRDARVRDLERVEDLRQLAGGELDVDDGSDDLDDLAEAGGGAVRGGGRPAGNADWDMARACTMGLTAVQSSTTQHALAPHSRCQRATTCSRIPRARRAASSPGSRRLTLASPAASCDGPRRGPRARRPRARVAAVAGAPGLGAPRRPARDGRGRGAGPRATSTTSSSRPAPARARRSPTWCRRSSAGARSSSRRRRRRSRSRSSSRTSRSSPRHLAVHGVTLRASLMKGLGNYVCRRRFGEARASGRRAAASALARIADWAAETRDRRLARSSPPCPRTPIVARRRLVERDAHRRRLRVLRRVLRHPDAARGRGRPDRRRQPSPVLRRPRPAHRARGAPHASALPPYDAIIFDEAHQLEDVATDFFGVRVSSARVDAFLRDAERALAAANALEALKSGPVR